MAKETANNGFIKIDRGILDWQHITEPVLVQVFIYLLVKANHQEGWWKGHKCERGATFVSIRTMCDDLAMSPHTAIKALRTLENSGEVVRTQVTQKLSKTKLVNYSKYQDFSIVSVAKTATQTATQTATKQERKERKEDKERDNKTRAHEKILQEWLNNRITLERFCMTEHLTIDQFTQLAQAKQILSVFTKKVTMDVLWVKLMRLWVSNSLQNTLMVSQLLPLRHLWGNNRL